MVFFIDHVITKMNKHIQTISILRLKHRKVINKILIK